MMMYDVWYMNICMYICMSICVCMGICMGFCICMVFCMGTLYLPNTSYTFLFSFYPL